MKRISSIKWPRGLTLIVTAIAITSAVGCSSASRDAEVEIPKGEIMNQAQLLNDGSARDKLCVSIEDTIRGDTDALCLNEGDSVDDLSAGIHFSGFFNDSIDRFRNRTGIPYCAYPDAFYEGIPQFVEAGISASMAGKGISSIQPCPQSIIDYVNDAIPVDNGR
ncbi:hypothetical protein ACH4C6_35895 [Streptomyces sp. NPDC017943]|uniref:hypothetical protein n=1 Tax=Streptomyces TaxID=1883 RepID=UPI00345662C0